MEDFAPAVSELRRHFETGRTRPLRWRLEQLEALERFLHNHEAEFQQAAREDLGRPALETSMEIQFTRAELRFAIQHLPTWVKPQRVRTNLFNLPGRSTIFWEPLGVVLLISPWNYPLHLTVAPLVAALSAGNCAVIKPSEYAPRASSLLARRLPEYLDPSAVRVIEGGVPETTELLRERFDHILYTGSGQVARVILEAAAKHLTPVTLELGGKSPCLIDRSANLKVAVRRILWLKFFNAGQTCVAPDYVLACRDVEDELLALLEATVKEFYGDDPRRSPDFGRIVNARHHQRLMGLMQSGEVVVGGEGDEADRYIAPTILRNVPEESPVMAEEIFGPILPVLRVADMDEAIAFVNRRPKPLAVYLFAEDEAVQRRVVERTSSGGCTVNHVALHGGNPDLPFGGVGASGMGAYHGRTGFETFSHCKSVLEKPTRLDPPLLYPPYGELKLRLIQWLLK
jgi:aldehyde dehydrogenase (NAD+)